MAMAMAIRRNVLVASNSQRWICSCALRGATAQPGGEEYSAMYGAGWDSGGAQVKVGVWWDFENCNVPFGMDAHKVGMNIVSGLRLSGFKGPVSISGYGDMLQLARAVQESLNATGIRLHHVPSGGKESESSDRALLMDLLMWTIDNPPPAHLFLISGDRDFSTALHKLRMRNYNVLLACPAGNVISPALLGAASRVWYWNSLVRGEGLVAATSWSSDGPPPRPILPPLKPPPPTSVQGSKVEQETAGWNTNMEKVPYFSSQIGNVNSSQEKTSYCSPPQPAACPPLPPPFSLSPSPAPPSSVSSGTAKSPQLSPYSVSSPLFPSVCTVPPPSAKASLTKTEQCQASAWSTTLTAEAGFSKANSTATRSPDNNRSFMHDRSSKAEGIQDVLGRLDSLLKSHPQGLWMSELQALMASRKIQFDGDFFGHKKLVPYLLTLPRIARVERHLMKDNKTWSYMFFSSTAPASDMKSSKRAGYPRDILCQLGDLFGRYPKGIWLGDFNAQLVARGIRLDGNFYGHVKVVPFLLSLPEMVKIERRFISDRWNYMFMWNPLQSMDSEWSVQKSHQVVKRNVPIEKQEDVGNVPRDEPVAVFEEQKETLVQEKTSYREMSSSQENVSQDTVVHEPENELVRAEEQAAVCSPIDEASESDFKQPEEERIPSDSSFAEAESSSSGEVGDLMITSVDRTKTAPEDLGAGTVTEEQSERSGDAHEVQPLEETASCKISEGPLPAVCDESLTKAEETEASLEKDVEPEASAGKTEETSIDADRVLELFACNESPTPAIAVPETVPENSTSENSTSQLDFQETAVLVEETLPSASYDSKVVVCPTVELGALKDSTSVEQTTKKTRRSYKKKAASEVENADKPDKPTAPSKSRKSKKALASKQQTTPEETRKCSELQEQSAGLQKVPESVIPAVVTTSQTKDGPVVVPEAAEVVESAKADTRGSLKRSARKKAGSSCVSSKKNKDPQTVPSQSPDTARETVKKRSRNAGMNSLSKLKNEKLAVTDGSIHPRG